MLNTCNVRTVGCEPGYKKDVILVEEKCKIAVEL